jgi:hypothetical protein
MMKRYVKQTGIVILLLGVVLCGLLSISSVRNRVILYFERDSIEQAIKHYFACEMNRNFEKLYQCLAPSPVYRRSHTYEDFLADVRNSPVRIREYTIVDIYNLTANHDREAFPLVEKFVQAEVEVILYFTDTNHVFSFNQCFTFLKEGGVWLKG